LAVDGSRRAGGRQSPGDGGGGRATDKWVAPFGGGTPAGRWRRPARPG